ncbi:hypothetical protein BG125_001210 [Shigella sonnei]|nr:hypothetical protein [Shigella sonnei]
MSLQKNLLTKTFEALLNAATQTPTDEVMNRDGINLMLQGFELIMQAHGFTDVDPRASVGEKPAVSRGESDQAILVEIRDLLRNMAGVKPGIKISCINQAEVYNAVDTIREFMAKAIRQSNPSADPLRIEIMLKTLSLNAKDRIMER